MLNLQVVQKILLVNQNCCPEVPMHASGDIRAQVREELPKDSGGSVHFQAESFSNTGAPDGKHTF